MDSTRRTFLAVTAGTLSVGLAGCTGNTGSQSDDETTETTTAAPTEGQSTTTAGATTTMAGDATVRTRSHAELGTILVDSAGMTLYMFESDTQGAGESVCTDSCAEAWPPLTVESADAVSAEEDVSAELGTIERADGSTQVTANGWPLYYFASDEEPGDAKGQGVNDIWWVLDAEGSVVKPGSMTTTATETTTSEEETTTGGDAMGDDTTTGSSGVDY
ncbi:COG4315 family predicted lipoprotein [Halorussus halophilus]|uniref:COG4315 family predicted lipoprotein n=1 Tax=Halorussus halophilus TaxID=2650975 RepID=UPI001300E022|nr:hypothetical protein [Halorussus halophilus]